MTLTAEVGVRTPGSGTPTGTVTFSDGGAPIGSGSLVGGRASFTSLTLAIGDPTITARYSGDQNFTASSGPLNGNPQLPRGPAVGSTHAHVNHGRWRISIVLPAVNLDPERPHEQPHQRPNYASAGN